MGAEAAISTVIQLLADVLIQKVKFIRGVKGQMKTLEKELTRMQAFLQDANKKQAEDERVRNWISEIRELAFDAEDTIEMFALNVETANSRGLLQGCACFPNHVRRLHKIGEEIEEILDRLAKIRESRVTYGIIDLGQSGEPAGRLEVEVRRRLDPWRKDEHLVGMEDHVEKLLEPIMDQESKGLSVVAIEGMGGIGKSTLARELYNHPGLVSCQFDCRAWVIVSSEFTPLETIKQLILETSSSEQEKKERLEEMKQLEGLSRDGLYLEVKLKEMLYKQLEGKTYFIILDDVWEMEHFVLLKNIVPNEKDKTSRLLFTTRNKDIANRCRIWHKMEFLDSDKSWELFLKKGLVNRSEEFPKELEHIGRQIVKKCEGLPLAIIVMGGLLAEIRSDKDEWQEALNQLDSHLLRAESSISAILELSYQNLSAELRSCFLCLAFFKEDATIPVKRLVNIMVGQGLIKNTGRATTEAEIARGYLDMLINRNMVQVTSLSFKNQIKSCHMHDCLRDICLQKAKEEIGLEVLKWGDEISSNKPRHCIVQCDGPVSFSINNKKRIRSLFLLDAEYSIEEIESINWKSFQLLKNLDLHGDFDGMQRLPNCFRLLHGLKQLRMCGSCCGEIDIPTWLSTLKKLEILDLSSWEVVKFPDVALEMNSLRHIYAYYIVGLKMTTDSWKNIESIKVVSRKDWMRNSLRMKDVSCHTRVLGINLHDSYDEDNEEELKTMGVLLEKLENLVELYLTWGTRLGEVTITISRLTNLTKFKLRSHMMKCLSASMFPPNLSHLTLCETRLFEDPMQELSKLPKLSYLKLKLIHGMSRMQVLHDGFRRLKGLFLEGLFDLRSVEIEEGGMPQLKLFQVSCCPGLDTKNLSNKSYQLQIIQSKSTKLFKMIFLSLSINQ